MFSLRRNGGTSGSNVRLLCETNGLSAVDGAQCKMCYGTYVNVS